jgi:hypothetical protein
MYMTTVSHEVTLGITLPPELLPFSNTIIRAGKYLVEINIHPIDPVLAQRMAAQGVVNNMRELHQLALDGTTAYGLELRQDFIHQGNFPPRPLPDYI